MALIDLIPRCKNDMSFGTQYFLLLHLFNYLVYFLIMLIFSPMSHMIGLLFSFSLSVANSRLKLILPCCTYNSFFPHLSLNFWQHLILSFCMMLLFSLVVLLNWSICCYCLLIWEILKCMHFQWSFKFVSQLNISRWPNTIMIHYI